MGDEQAWRQRNREIWQQELEAFVPSRLVDVHVHVFNEASLPAGEAFPAGGPKLRSYDFSQLRADLAEVFPGRETGAVCFGLPFPEYDRRENNRYVADGCDDRRLWALRLVDPAEDPRDVRRDVIAGRFRGLKPYPNYVRKADRGQVEIDEMLPEGIMAVADELRLIVMLHIPRRGRLEDALNREQIRRLCTRWPGARIILAHVGRAYYLRGSLGHLEELRDLPNLYFDTAMVNHAEVLEHLFATVAPDRVLFGSDIPIALAAGKSVEINHQYAYITPVPWELSICDAEGRVAYTSFLYEELRAIRRAVERLGLSREYVEGFFDGNARRLLGAAGG